MSRDFGSILRGDAGYSAQNSGGVIVLAQNAVAKILTGTAAKTELARAIIPGGLMGLNGVLRLTSLWSFTSSANAKTLFADLAGTSIMTPGFTANGSVQLISMVRNRGIANSQVGFSPASNNPIGPSGIAASAFAIDTSIDQILSLAGQLTNTGESITLESYTIEILNPL